MSDADNSNNSDPQPDNAAVPEAAASNNPAPPATATTTTTPTANTTTIQLGSVQVQHDQPLSLDWTQMGNMSPPVRYPSDVADLDPNETEILLVGTAGQKITNMGHDFYKHVSPDLVTLILRSHLIRTMEGIEGFQKLEILELYDNQVQALQCLNDGPDGAPGKTLRVLDISYNVIRDMQPVEFCPNLQELYIANNKLKSMAGLKNLVHLKKIDLGANRLRTMDPDELANLTNLEELWLGKNKIETIQGLQPLTKLRRLDIQSNRLEVIEGLTGQQDALEELYLAHNGITVEGASTPTGLQLSFPKLSVLDLSRNRLTNASPFAHLTSLDELWLSGNKIATFADIACLGPLGQSLDTIYLEYNPLQDDPLYRKKIAELLPSLSQIDANMIQGPSAYGMPPTALPGSFETDEERLKRLRDEAVERAKRETEANKKQGES